MNYKQAIKELILRDGNNLLGFILMGVTIKDDSNIPTACIGEENLSYIMRINPEYWRSLDKDQKKGLLLHELFHPVYHHISLSKNFPSKLLFNIAADLVVNQEIPEKMLPPGGVTLEGFEKMGIVLPPKKSSKYYYEALMKSGKSISNGDGNEVQVDGNPSGMNSPNHDGWKNISSQGEGVSKVLEDVFKSLVKEADRQTSGSNRGLTPGGLEELINFTEEAPKFNWKQYLRRFVGGSSEVYKKKSRKKVNYRFPDNPGRRSKLKNRILVGIDTSGSVSQSELEEFLTEICAINKQCEVTILHCDTRIQHEEHIKSGRIKQYPFSAKGRGGTSFQPVIDYYKKHLRDYAALIYLTDGEAPAPEGVVFKQRVLWVHSSQCSINENLPGYKIQIPK